MSNVQSDFYINCRLLPNVDDSNNSFLEVLSTLSITLDPGIDVRGRFELNGE